VLMLAFLMRYLVLILGGQYVGHLIASQNDFS